MSGGEIPPEGMLKKFKNGKRVGACSVYVIEEDTWKPVEALNYARSYHSMVALDNGMVYAICGMNA